jgi:hypothetical protein
LKGDSKKGGCFDETFRKSFGHFGVEQLQRNVSFYLLLFDALPAEMHSGGQGCQTSYFQTKNPYLGKFWRAFQSKMLV